MAHRRWRGLTKRWSACVSGHCIRSISTHKVWWRCGEKLCLHGPCCVVKPTAIDITPNSSASRLIDHRAWQSMRISARYLRKQCREAMTSIRARSGRFDRCRVYPCLKDNSSSNGSTCCRSFPRGARRCIQGGETFRTQRSTHYFARGPVPRRRGNAVQRHLTTRGSARMGNRMPSPNPRSRGAQPHC
jgi:hypothetical protein